MRTRLGIGLGLSLLAVAMGQARSDDRAAALEVIGRAVRAHGGEQRLAKARAAHRTGKGTMLLYGQASPFTTDTTLQLPDRVRDVIDFQIGEQKTRMVLIINGYRGWQVTPAGTAELDKDRLAEVREETYVIWLTTLVPLQNDKGFEFTTLPEAKVLGRPALGVKVASKGHADASLYFDKQSGLLVKIARQARLAGRAIDKEYLYGDHKDFDGVKLATRYTELLNGNKQIELTITGYDFPERVDAKTFEKP
jgi:hypothetical protein